MPVVKYFYVSVILCPFAVEGEYKTGHTQNICGILSVGGFTAHTLAGSDVRQVSQSSFAGKRHEWLFVQTHRDRRSCAGTAQNFVNETPVR